MNKKAIARIKSDGSVYPRCNYSIWKLLNFPENERPNIGETKESECYMTCNQSSADDCNPTVTIEEIVELTDHAKIKELGLEKWIE